MSGRLGGTSGVRQCRFCRLRFLTGWELADHVDSIHRLGLSAPDLCALARGCATGGTGLSLSARPGGGGGR